MRQLTKRLFLIILILTGMSQTVFAQNNPYKIDDALYAYFMRMVALKNDPACLPMVDTLYTRALIAGDRKAQCLAYTIPVNYRFGIPGHYDEMKAAADELRRVSRATGYLRYYFFATSNEITYLLNDGKSAQAIRLARQMHTEAFTEGNAHGMYSCLLALGNVYLSRKEFRKALDYYRQAFDQLTFYLPEQDDTQILSRIAVCYNELGEKDNALRCTRRALTTAKTETGLMRALEQNLGIIYECGEYEEFLQYYKIAHELMPKVCYVYREEWYRVETYKNMYDGRYEQAHEYAAQYSDAYERNLLQSMVYEHEHDYVKAYEYACKATLEGERQSRARQNFDLEEMESQERHQRLVDEAHALQMKQQHIEASRRAIRFRLITIVAVSILVLQFIFAQIRHRHACVVEAKNRELEAEKRVEEEERVRAEEAQRAAERAQHMAEQERERAEVAQHKAEDAQHVAEKAQHVAEEARYKAELADRMKTAFVQNMSHEIRTPLNAIVGFSSILTDTSFELPPEDRQDIAARIAENSELLTTLVNDILDLSNLESGNDPLDLHPVAANVVCTYALDTVMFRKPEDVELRFTTDVSDDFTFTTDGPRVQQVLINFLTNAEKNTTHGEIVLHCSAHAHPGFVTYSVEDTGIGVPPDKAEVIFERFTKLDAFKQGSGLGLSICAVISDRLGGHVYLDTSYTRGARFVFEVPDGHAA